MNISAEQNDNLKRIEGIGPKIEKILKSNGINSFDQLKSSKLPLLKSLLKEAGPKYNTANPGSWRKQADLASKGKWDKLATLQDKLKGGK